MKLFSCKTMQHKTEPRVERGKRQHGVRVPRQKQMFRGLKQARDLDGDGLVELEGIARAPKIIV